MNYTTPLVRVMLLFAAQSALATQQNDHENHHQSHQQDYHIEEEIVVSAPFQKSVAETALPVNVLTGENYRKSVADSLGDTLQNLPGVHNSSFGPGVGQAVIRGQSGNRVQVLQNSVSTIDVSAVSPDHANGVEPMIATGMEVVRGPATLLYGNGAIGGIVNVLDDRIPESIFNEPEFVFEQSHSTVNDQDRSVAKLNLSAGNINLHLDGYYRNNNDVEIDGYAIEALAEPDTNSKGFIGNSHGKADGHTVGLSTSGDWGYVGFAINELNNEYGLPPGTHAHHDEDDHHDDEDDHDHDDHDEDDHEADEDGELVRLDMQKTGYDFRSELRFQDGFVERINTSINVSDYEHTEFEIGSDGTRVPGTRFENRGTEARVTLNHRPVSGWQGVWGLQITDTTFSAEGEEAFIPETDAVGTAAFVVERLDLEKATWELGARIERYETDPGANCAKAETVASLSGSLLYELSESSNLLVALSRSERSPTLEERYSNVDTTTCRVKPAPDLVLHAATALLEQGDPSLDTEISHNLELGYRYDGQQWESEFNIYYNDIADYIYLNESGATINDQGIASYQSEDARFWGLEGRVEYFLPSQGPGELSLQVFGDLVRAEFDKLGDVPRIPPARLGMGVSWRFNNWTLDTSITRVFEQDRTASNEPDTSGYTRLSLYTDYHLDIGDRELLFYAKGTNLLDEEIRNHTSFLKQFAPEPGRGFTLGVRFIY